MDSFEDLTPDQLVLIAEFRQRMKDDLPEDMFEDTYMFYRFLKARNFNMKQSEAMLRKHLDYKKIFKFDSILTDYVANEVLTKHALQNFLGYDKHDNLVGYWAVGGLDGRGILKSSNKFDLQKFALQALERDHKYIRQHTEKIANKAYKCIYIYDLEHLNLAKVTDKPSIELFKIVLTLMQDNYPEILKSLYLINASIYFTIVFPLIKVILSKSIVEKLKIFGKDGWKEALLQEVDADVLPVYLGGTRTDPDGNPQCKTILNYGGTIPEHYFLTKNIDIMATKRGVRKETIPRRSSISVEMEVEEPGTVLEWEFELLSHDIGVRVVMRDEENTTMIPFYKFETEYGPVREKLNCEKRGTYVIVFDNTYSWVHSKEIYFRTWLTYPEEKRSRFIKDN